MNGDTCDLYRQINYPSFGGLTPDFQSSDSAPNGKMAACQLGVAVGVLGFLVGSVALVDAYLYLREIVPPMSRPAFVYIIEWLAYLIMTVLWCAYAIISALGYVATCINTVCTTPGNEVAFPSRPVVLTTVVFTWLSLMPWASDFGLITREHFRRVNYRKQMQENEEHNAAVTGGGADAMPENPNATASR